MLCPLISIVLLGGGIFVLYFVFKEFFGRARVEDRPTAVAPHEPPKDYAPKGSPEDREVRRRRAVRTLSTLSSPPSNALTPQGMYWDTLLGEYCYLAEHIFFLRELEAYDSEASFHETELERQSLIDTPRFNSSNLSAAQRLGSSHPKEDSYPKSYPQANNCEEDKDDD